MDKSYIIMKYSEEMWRQCAETERQRANLTYLVSIFGILELVLLNYLDNNIILITILTFTAYAVLSLFLSIKLYERWQFSRNRVHNCYKELAKLNPEVDILKLRDKSDTNYYSNIRNLHAQWIRYSIHILVIFEGLLIYGGLY